VGYVKQGANDHPNKAMADPDAGKRWMTFQFDLAVGEKIYGLGERFGPFIKNGQVCFAISRSYRDLDIG
jgi:alpha-D-xyloside xylohydrolase